MANNWNIRRRVVQHAEKIEDSKEVLRTFLRRNNYSSKVDINQLMSTLGETSVAHIDAAIQRTQNTVVIWKTLLEVLKTEKKKGRIVEATFLRRRRWYETTAKRCKTS